MGSLYDAVADYAAEIQMRAGKSPRWDVLVSDVPRGYRIKVTFDGADVAVVDHFGRQLSSAARDAFVAFEEWRADRPDQLERALSVSLEVARARHA